MSDKKFEQQIEAIEKLAGDKGAQQEIGKRLVQEVAKAVINERKGAEIDEPDVELAIRKGDLVPPQFQDRIRTDEAGRALHDATLQSQNLIIWLRVWLRLWLRIIWGFELAQTPLNRFDDFAEVVDFHPDEIKMLDRLRKIAN